jgi:hypothetical protein
MHHLHPSHSNDEEDIVFKGSGGQLAPETTASESSVHRTCPNSYGIYRVYPGGEASYSPDEILLDSVTDGSVAMTKDSEEEYCPWWTAAPSSDANNYYAPFPTASHF